MLTFHQLPQILVLAAPARGQHDSKWTKQNASVLMVKASHQISKRIPYGLKICRNILLLPALDGFKLGPHHSQIREGQDMCERQGASICCTPLLTGGWNQSRLCEPSLPLASLFLLLSQHPFSHPGLQHRISWLLKG